MKRSLLASFVLPLLVLATEAAAHEIRPAYLQISDRVAGDLMCSGKCLSGVKWFWVYMSSGPSHARPARPHRARHLAMPWSKGGSLIVDRWASKANALA